MAHIKLPEGVPGIVGPMIAYPETQVHLSGLAEALLRGPSSLTPAERELIASYVSSGNECTFCTQSHAAAARVHFGEECRLVNHVLADVHTAPVSPKMKALLAIAERSGATAAWSRRRTLTGPAPRVPMTRRSTIRS